MFLRSFFGRALRPFFVIAILRAMPSSSPFDGIIGHATIVRLLSSSLAHPAPAYVFVGRPHLGKRSVAEKFVNALLQSDQPVHPDLILLEPEEGKKQISVEQVRDARERLSMRPTVAPRVVAFLPTADRLNESGTNALLKVLEEPPAGAVFVLIAEDIGRLPATVLSRSVVMRFGNVSTKEIVAGLVARGVGQKDAEKRAVLSRGCPGLAIEPPGSENAGTSFVRGFFSATTLGARLSRIDELAKTCDASADPNATWRDAILSAMRATGDILPQKSVEATIFGIALVTALKWIGGAISPRLALEAGALRLSTSPNEEVRRLFPTHVPRLLPLVYGSLVQSD